MIEISPPTVKHFSRWCRRLSEGKHHRSVQRRISGRTLSSDFSRWIRTPQGASPGTGVYTSRTYRAGGHISKGTKPCPDSFAVSMGRAFSPRSHCRLVFLGRCPRLVWTGPSALWERPQSQILINGRKRKRRRCAPCHGPTPQEGIQWRKGRAEGPLHSVECMNSRGTLRTGGKTYILQAQAQALGNEGRHIVSPEGRNGAFILALSFPGLTPWALLLRAFRANELRNAGWFLLIP